MLFAIYIQKLHDCIEPTTQRGEFTETILKKIIKKEDKLKYKGTSYNGFFDGKTQGKGDDRKIVGDKIQTCAKKIVGILDESEDQTKSLPKFKEYLKNLQFNTAAKNKLCDSFRCEIPDINVDNYIDKLSELLIKIIKEAADKENTDRTNNPQIDDSGNDGKDVTKSTTINSFVDNHIEDNRINIINNLISVDNTNEKFTFGINHAKLSTTYSSHVSKINACIIELTTILNNLLRAGKVYAKNVDNSPPSKLYTSISGWEELSNWFDKYQELNTNLGSYYEIYECPLLEPALPFKDKFSIRSFWLCHSTREPNSSAILGDINKYKNVLKEILKTIEDGDVK